MKKAFEKIYDEDLWQSGQGVGSGEGSAPDGTAEYREFLQEFLRNKQIRSVLDLGCGDWQSSRLIDWTGIDYLGLDVVETVIDRNNKHFATEHIKFSLEDISNCRLQPSDLLIVKDVLQHWPNRDILNFLPRIRDFKYCLLINCAFQTGMQNRDILQGQFRPVDLTKPPFGIGGEVVFSFHTDFSKFPPSFRHKDVLLLDASKGEIPVKIGLSSTGGGTGAVPEMFRGAVRTLQQDGPGALAAKVRNFILSSLGLRRGRPLKSLIASPPPEALKDGINVSGYIKAESGTGESCRTMIRTLQTTAVPLALNNFPALTLRQKDKTYSDSCVDINPYKINLSIVNADQVEAFKHYRGLEYVIGRYNIGYWVWELPSFPPELQGSFRYFHEIWTPSTFAVEAIRQATEMPVVRIPHSIHIDDFHEYGRGHFGLSPDSFLFFYMFDFQSYFERKNPLAAVRAFKKAFGKGESPLLLLKCTNGGFDRENYARLEEEAEGYKVIIIDRYLSRDEIYSLLKLCDAYVSLHRSEGFGLTIAEAMHFGKPVIATNYSANTDFQNEKNSYPVDYQMVEIEKDVGPYRKGNTWADADVDHAAELMRRVFEQPEEARSKGEQAYRDIRDTLSPEKVGEMAMNRLRAIDDARTKGILPAS